uniref:LPS export ABC transporter periplasmic protein LptC n=1 Tax=Ningiella ruwaisensis TaxID=2364274 RepID=UPI0010A0AD43|nr:LPS export ABC transporter periplasmic protein LptC [Ningiella ruwaisensis]
MNRIGYSVAFIFTVVFLLYLPILLDDDVDTEISEDDSPLIPNYQAVNLNSKLFDKSGKLSHQVAAAKMEHYDELGFAVFEKPVYTLYMDDGEPWRITADEGTLYNNNRIQLEKNVKIVNLRTSEFVKEITTEFIEINLQEKTLKSDQIVNISGIDYRVQSIGLYGDLVTQQYELREHVQTKFYPNR